MAYLSSSAPERPRSHGDRHGENRRAGLTDLLRQLASPSAVQPDVLVGVFRDVERMHSMGRITGWQLKKARQAATRRRSSATRREGGPRSPETRADERG